MTRAIIFLTHFATALSLPLRESVFDMNEERATGKVNFYLYTAKNPKIPQQLLIGNEDSVRNSNFDKTRHTKFIIHGWGGSYTGYGMLREAYFSKNNYNIISVDWHAYSKLNYLSSRAKAPIVGQDVAEFIDFLNEKFKLKFEQLVVIGHSLGAHVAGFTGKHVKRGKIAGIVGLDPAYPLYSFEDSTTRLSSDDALYVQTIQTNGNVKGFLKPIGSAAFYPNWGRSQPGCGFDLDGGCAHSRCVYYYAEAIRGYSFAPVRKCSSFDEIFGKNGCKMFDAKAEIGDPLEMRRTDGIFYFETTDKAPFGHFSDRTIRNNTK